VRAAGPVPPVKRYFWRKSSLLFALFKRVSRALLSQNRFGSTQGTGTGLPSVAQGKKPGAGAGGNKSFPDLGGKTGGGQLADKVQGAKGGQLAGKVQGAQGGQLADIVQSAKGGQLAGKVQGAPGGQFAGKLQGDNQGRLGNNLSPERNQALANRQQYWDKWGKDNQGRLSNFKADRSKDWSGINDFRKDHNVVGSFNKPEWNNYKNNVNNFRTTVQLRSTTTPRTILITISTPAGGAALAGIAAPPTMAVIPGGGGV
jgi:hypothetical protein